MGITADRYSEGALRGGIKKFRHNRLWRHISKFQAFLQQINKKP